MSDILKPGQIVHTEASNIPCSVEKFLGGGGQGEVYQANLGGEAVALKWYFPHYLPQDPYLHERLETAIKSGPPSDRFLWPMELAKAPGLQSFGYIMPLREVGYKGILELMKGKINPSFRALTTAGLELANSFFQLHAKGLCYRDISFGNVFLDPDTGDVLICDNDNVSVDGEGSSGVLGTPSFMAPEVVRGEALPSRQTDLFSLAVLLFYMFMVHHPLEGSREAAIKCLDLSARNKLYGTDPLFIFDPADDSNRPVPDYHDNALAYWPIYPQFLRDRFTEAFTKGLHDPQNGRVAESVWRSTMSRLRDSIVYCQDCGAENFYDAEAFKASGGRPNSCWSCSKEICLPGRIRIGKSIVMLNYNTQLFPHHVDSDQLYNFSQPVASVTRRSENSRIWGLQNCSETKWVITTVDGSIREVQPGRAVTLAVGTKVNFGKIEGEIRI
jgi:eukaryotic-like serine/threonine-protein kinase